MSSLGSERGSCCWLLLLRLRLTTNHNNEREQDLSWVLLAVCIRFVLLLYVTLVIHSHGQSQYDEIGELGCIVLLALVLVCVLVCVYVCVWAVGSHRSIV